MYREEKIVDKIEILEDGTILVREVIRVFKDDIKIAETYHRASFAPDEEITNMPENIVSLASVVRTQEVIDNYNLKKQEALFRA